jgi:hypothetical protein
MPYSFEHKELCPICPFGVCIEDRRQNPIPGRKTKFRLRQHTALGCTFGDFVPGTDNDPDPARTFDEYLSQFRENAMAAGAILFPSEFDLAGPAIAKVEGDIFELLEAAALWNACSVWNRHMDGHSWDSSVLTLPEGTVPTPTRKVAVITLPRGYDTTRLFNDDVRSSIMAHEQSLKLRGMELGLSAPDIVGLRIPEPLPPEYAPFIEPLDNLGADSRVLLEGIYEHLEGTLEARSFLFAIAVKKTTRSDRLYQPLFEANILKYLIEVVLRGAAFRFHVHMGSLKGADVRHRYNAASLISLMRGGEPVKAVDSIYHAESPVNAAQTVLDTFPYFPL